MLKSKFRSSTSLVLSLTLAVGPAWAQEGAADCDPAAPEFPCTVDGSVIETADGLAAALGLTVDAEVGVEAETQAVEAAPIEEPVADVVEEVPVEEPAVEEAPAEIVEETPAEEVLEPAPEEEVVEEAPAVDVVEEAPAADVVEEEVPTEEAPAVDVVEEVPTEEVPTEALTEEAPTANVLEETPTEEVAEEAPASDETQDDLTQEVVVVEETPTAPTPEETVQDAPTAAAAGNGDAEGEVTTESVVEGDVRSADEDFANSANAAPTARNSDSGLSNFEKAVLLGLGAVAIGSILDNGDEVVSNSGDRIVLQGTDGQLRVLKDDDVLLRQPGSEVRTERFNDGSTRTFVTRVDGSEVVTIRAADGRVVRRALVLTDGSQIELFDDTQAEQAVDVTTLPRATQPIQQSTSNATEEELRAALAAEMGVTLDRTFSLRQVRAIREVRELAPVIELSAITFLSGSAAIQPDQASELAVLGTAIKNLILDRPSEVFLIEGHTDAVGDAGYNLALSDRRAETVALALTQYFDVPAANLVTQGYGETVLKVQTLSDEQANRRATVRNVTQLLR